jgi:hypothetical protein
MTATMVALVGAVATVIAYGALADRFDYASVRRRQLDVVAALVAFLCFGGIVYGGVQTRLHARDHRAPPAAPTVTTPAPDGAAADPGQAIAVAPAPSSAPVQLLAPPVDGPQPPPVPVGETAGGSGTGPDRDEPALTGYRGVPLATLPALPTPVALATNAVAPTLGPTLVAVVATATRLVAPATATAVSPIVTRVVPPVAPPTRTPVPPTPVLPTQVPMPLPTSTPNCGNPAQAQVTMSDLSASADRSGTDLVIRFRAQVRNESAFPVTIADTSVTAVNKVAGAEQYGYARLPDVTIEPGAVITLDGAVNLTKLPPPFGTTELCVSFALDTCGLRAERPVRQCHPVRGF